MNIHKRAKIKYNYSKLEFGDNKSTVIHKQHKRI